MSLITVPYMNQVNNIHLAGINKFASHKMKLTTAPQKRYANRSLIQIISGGFGDSFSKGALRYAPLGSWLFLCLTLIMVGFFGRHSCLPFPLLRFANPNLAHRPSLATWWWFLISKGVNHD